MSVSFSDSFIKPTFGEKIFSNESEVLFHWNCNILCIYLLALHVLCCETRRVSRIITPMSAHRAPPKTNSIAPPIQRQKLHDVTSPMMYCPGDDRLFIGRFALRAFDR
jgi:hypothetical protein